ncbi:MAG TPA: class I SAM-dependent methyltransferase [Acidimicrobiales bacterium]|jgi:SAM-dependent methyltransferase|nr:class I SAM-dependent methyltransferase [Acidimicrobiales bacterium]
MDRHQWNERYAAQPLLWDVDPDPFLGAELAGTPPGRALDLGAGEGRTSLWLAERGWQVTAVDFSDVALDRGRRRVEGAGATGTVEWVCADLTTYEPPPGPFDLVLVLFVHLPAEPRRRLLRAAAAALAPGGAVLVVGYDTTHATEGQGGPRDPAILFSADDIVADLDGLVVERAERLRVGDAVDAIVRARRP